MASKSCQLPRWEGQCIFLQAGATVGGTWQFHRVRTKSHGTTGEGGGWGPVPCGSYLRARKLFGAALCPPPHPQDGACSVPSSVSGGFTVGAVLLAGRHGLRDRRQVPGALARSVVEGQLMRGKAVTTSSAAVAHPPGWKPFHAL